MADFAKAQLLKYGWTEGKGLGKQEDGIVDAIKPKLKFDTAGVGHKSDICNNWWESVFNKAAKNVSVDTNSSGVSLNVVDQDATIFSNRQDLKSLQKEHRSGYKAFLKTSILENGKVTQDEIKDIEIEVKPELSNFIVSDDELFKACGGRTAHKGARHGLNLNGKLARIAQQEKEMLAALSLRKGSVQPKEVAEKKDKESKKKKRKRKAAETESEEDIIDEDNKDISHLLNISKDKGLSNKSQRKSNKKKINSLVQMMDKSCKLEESREGAIKSIECNMNKKKRKTASHDAGNEFIYTKSVEKMTRLCKEMEKIIEKCKKLDPKTESSCDTRTAKDEEDYLDLFKDITFKRYEQQDPEKFLNQMKNKMKNRTDDKKMNKLSEQLDNSCSLSGKGSKKKKKKSRDRFVAFDDDIISRIDANKLNSKIEKKKRKRLLKEESLALLVKNMSSKSKGKPELSDFL
ncbi:G patch domain-containing protein 4 [Belonocnema kinseyi]|uniref:G patch domain-containing protein 4 n=1 Tax=Belonocnema kinseyi TaxID=2817044 RepID=UPI00143D95F7|nr:G patch domain-containing protein 4 [Belonocnema kinseyi]